MTLWCPQERIGRSGVLLRTAPQDAAPFTPQALVFEEDTHLMLSARGDLGAAAGDHPIRIMTDLHAFKPAAPGSIVTQPGPPLRVLAVVRDLAATPDCQPAWIDAALDAIVTLAGQRGLQALGMHVLGCRYGRGDPARFVSALTTALDRHEAQVIERIWLMLPPAATDPAQH